jgi:membrane-associated phospholipid phosphatase
VWLDRVAAGGMLWIAIAGLLSARRRDPGPAIATARAAWTASLIAHLLARVVDRRRPLASRLVTARVTRASSPSFPSRHAATAFAGATSVGLHERRLLAPLLAVATAAASSRVYRRLHHASDAVAGGALGAAVTAADMARTAR